MNSLSLPYSSSLLSRCRDDCLPVILLLLPQEITAEKAHEILKRISDEDCEALGFDIRYARPDWMLMTVFPVPPPPVRPGVMMDSSSR